MFIRTKDYMKKLFNIEKKACIFGGYCMYWKRCVEEHNIQYFASPRIKAQRKTYQHKVDLRESQKEQKSSKNPDQKKRDKYNKRKK